MLWVGLILEEACDDLTPQMCVEPTYYFGSNAYQLEASIPTEHTLDVYYLPYTMPY